MSEAIRVVIYLDEEQAQIFELLMQHREKTDPDVNASEFVKYALDVYAQSEGLSDLRMHRTVSSQKLRTLRTKRNLTQQELAILANLSTFSVYKAERQDTPLRRLTLNKLAAALGVEARELLSDS